MEKKKVMVVDDDKNFLELVKLNLEETGEYEVVALLNAKDIISQVIRLKPDIILLDILMPVMDGIEVCDILNDNPDTRGIPIIIVSSLDKAVDKLKAYKRGVIDFLVKPIEKDNLIAKLEKMLKFK